MTPLTTIIEFFENYDFSENETLELDQCTKILDLEKFVVCNIQLLALNPSNNAFLTYYLRLEKAYKLINNI